MEIRPSSSLPRLKVADSAKQDEKKASEGSSGSIPLNSLDSAVENNAEAGKLISKASENLSNSNVEEANREASTASVRDVEQASLLAQKLAQKIGEEQDKAIAAQANQKNSSVQTLLR